MHLKVVCVRPVNREKKKKMITKKVKKKNKMRPAAPASSVCVGKENVRRVCRPEKKT